MVCVGLSRRYSRLTASGGKYGLPSTTSQRSLWAMTVPFQIARGISESQSLPDSGRQTRLIQRVKVQTGGAVAQQVVAQRGDDVEPERADRRGVVAVALEFFANPARDFSTARVGKARELRKTADRHDSGHDRDADAHRLALVDEAIVG